MVRPRRKNCRLDSNQTVRNSSQKNNLLSAKVVRTWSREEGPFTRAQRRQGQPITRNMRELEAFRKVKFICGCCCASSNNTAPKLQRAPISRAQSSKAHQSIKKHSTHKRKKAHKDKNGKGRVVGGLSPFGNGGCSRKGPTAAAPAVRRRAPAVRGPAPAAPTLSFTSSGEYTNLLPFAKKKGGKLHQESKKFVLKLGGHNPRVCDLDPICVECKQGYSFGLPDNVKSKLVHCFTKEMRAGFRFEPGCLGHKKQSFNESVQVLNNGRLPNFDSEQILSQSTNTKEQNEDETNDTHSGALSSHVHPEQESNGMQKKITYYNQNIFGNDLHVNNVELDGSKDFHLKNSLCMDTFGSVRCVDGQSDSPAQVFGPVFLDRESRDRQSMNLNSPTLDNAEDLDSFTCQRVRVYSGKTSVTCARTYLTWPFLSRKPEPAGNDDSSAGDISLFQNKLSGNEPTDLDPQKRISLSNQRVEEKQKNTDSTLKNAENIVGVSSDIIRNKNSQHPSCSSQQIALMLSENQNHFCEDLAAQLSRRPTSVQTPPPNDNIGSSTPSPSRLGLPETVLNLSAASFTDANSCSSSVSSSQAPLRTLTPTVFRITLPQVVSFNNLDSNDSCASSFLLPQDMELSLEKNSDSRSPQKLEPYFKTSPPNHKLTNGCKNNSTDNYTDPDSLLPPLLSPLNSPLKHIVSATSVKYQNGHEHNHKMLPKNHIPEIHDIIEKNHAYDCGWQQNNTFPTTKFVEAPIDEPQHQPLVTDTLLPASAALRETSSSPNSIKSKELRSSGESSTDNESYTSEKSVNDEPEDLEKPEFLDEIEAYEQDILLVDVFQDDPDLFGKLPQKSLLKLGPVRTRHTLETGHKKIVKIMPLVSESFRSNYQSVTPVNLDFLHNSPENSPRRPWRPQCSGNSALQGSTKKQFRIMGPAETRVVNAGEERNEHFPKENLCHNHISPLLASRLGLPTQVTNTPSAADVRWKKPIYCRNYFSESQNCAFKMCHFHHVPVEGEEKFCTETVAWFAKYPACLHKAGAVFTGYYQNNKPGLFFSKPVLSSLLRGLLQAGMLSDIFSVLRTVLAHNIVPEYEFLLDLFNFIREKSLMNFVPELMQLTFKMADAGLLLNLDCLDCVKNTPDLQHTVSSNSPKTISGRRLVTPSDFEYLSLAHVVVEMELCIKQEDWRRLGKVFQSICQSTQVSQVERISGRIAVALLSESKDRLTLPFAAFAETAGHNADKDSPVKSYLGRIGVSLMLRYKKTHQWAKGQKVVEVMSAAKVSYATMKGLFGNEDCTSRCHLVSVATELFLLNGSVEGALNTLRENEWFLASSAWPCEATDLEKRTHVLLGLAEQTSHRDTLEVLRNLPGLKEPNGHVDISKYTHVFTAHLQVCLDRQILMLASDLVDFMLSKNLTVDHAKLQLLLHKLGKQNCWLKAREIFRTSMNKGYHPGVSAPPGMMSLMVPSQLGEIELALTFEMFITVNATAILALPECITSTLTITLKRTQSCEGDYLSAGSRLLSAACIPQPKLGVHYTAVNSSQEQVFTLDISSARRWLRHNHLWANEVWTLCT